MLRRTVRTRNQVLDPSGKPGPEQRKILAERLVTERFRQWGLQANDLDAKDVGERFAKLSLRMPEETLRLILETTERIARAEGAKAKCNPKANPKRNQCLSRTAVRAASLAIEIAKIFPPPWEAEQEPIGILIAGLASFMDGALMATTHLSRETLSKLRNARRMLHSTLRPLKTKTGKTHWRIIQELAWLASGKGGARLSERSIRRFLEKPNLPRIPERNYWNKHWNLLVSVERLVPVRHADPFEVAAVRYLTTLD
jgi:hypothetical protein